MGDQRRGATPEPPAELIGDWKAAEQRLAMLALADPDLYVRHLRLVVQITSQLVEFGSVQDLVAAYDRSQAIVLQLVQRGLGEVVDYFDVASLAGTAWLVRYRQLADKRDQQRTGSRITAARRRGCAWVTISEARAPSSALPYPYELTTMRTSDGVALRASIDPDPDTYRPVYSVETLHLDPRTGAPIAGAPPARQETLADRSAWEDRIMAFRAKLDRGVES
jgi:hypothetical protein